MTRRNFLDIIGYAIGSYSIAILPGRLMVGRMTLDHVAEGSNPSPAANLLLALSSRGQDGWFSAIKPGFDSL
ncbi:MAG: hypothetical protein QG588_1119 [Candidatus Poribacteria bacterium]|nr:hypothetical protein [Candidatus Poribacteria bacterium]